MESSGRENIIHNTEMFEMCFLINKQNNNLNNLRFILVKIDFIWVN